MCVCLFFLFVCCFFVIVFACLFLVCCCCFGGMGQCVCVGGLSCTRKYAITSVENDNSLTHSLHIKVLPVQLWAFLVLVQSYFEHHSPNKCNNFGWLNFSLGPFLGKKKWCHQGQIFGSQCSRLSIYECFGLSDVVCFRICF